MCAISKKQLGPSARPETRTALPTPFHVVATLVKKHGAFADCSLNVVLYREENSNSDWGCV